MCTDGSSIRHETSLSTCTSRRSVYVRRDPTSSDFQQARRNDSNLVPHRSRLIRDAEALRARLHDRAAFRTSTQIRVQRIRRHSSLLDDFVNQIETTFVETLERLILRGGCNVRVFNLCVVIGAFACQNTQPNVSADTVVGLLPIGQRLVYDANQNVYWLANANAVVDPTVRTQVPFTPSNPDGLDASGAMDFQTATEWVQALNNSNYLKPYKPWQLPVTPSADSNCAVKGFGPNCSSSALGNLFYVGLGHSYGNSSAPGFGATFGQLQNLRPGPYWYAGPSPSPTGTSTFAFGDQIPGANTTSYNYFHVLPMLVGAIDGIAPGNTGIVPYANGMAIYDSTPYPTDGNPRTWVIDANLATTMGNPFNIDGSAMITLPIWKATDPNAMPVMARTIGKGGAMPYPIAQQAVANMAGYLSAKGSANWTLPSPPNMTTPGDLETLAQHLSLAAPTPSSLAPGNATLNAPGMDGPFSHLQPSFYWACPAFVDGSPAGCSPSPAPAMNPMQTDMQWSFNFDSGFQGTDEGCIYPTAKKQCKKFFVTVYYPGPTDPMLKCTTKACACGQAGGNWTGTQCL
jgi:hypothetical protein